MRSTSTSWRARRNAEAYIAHTRPRAVLLTGSVAIGEGDRYSDVDMLCYYDAPPPDEQLRAARRWLGEPELGADLGLRRTEMAVGEEYSIDGVTCQVGHILVASLEQDIATVLDDLDVSSPAQKRLLGLLEGVPLHGAGLIGRWQARAAAYPDALARAMVGHHLRQLPPVWSFQEYLARRDATLWLYQLLVEAVQHLLGVLAGLNRLYFSPFQFKRMRRFIGKMHVAPGGLAERIDGLFAADRPAAIGQIEDLTRETIALVTRHLPEADILTLPQQPGERERPWSLVVG